MNMMEEGEGFRQAHPVDTIEWVAAARDWSFERSCEDEIAMSLEGAWTHYSVSFSWIGSLEALHLGCAFDLKVPPHRRNEIGHLIALINEKIVIGHFGFWDSEGAVIYRNSLLLAGGVEATGAQAEAMLGVAIDQCERFYQAFQFVIWADKPAKEALAAAMFDTVGEA
ncbi:YbjN domain-containing protein [Fulvimarina sp. 2208YS6-2-32]|uniref:YbjN domain-containing protein n=1 Tax=Fulvimarina uroteuthidis TaxID=3098149 RepID=A0ABU5I3X2_9HYPH|nr:YbjN domain-containing protein [Fulvimarina sp. 2208YS6-2-32]MDY8110086.1 YbjN domain-containing protein [Fulvimarina sp. 2208YS6-2-32]